MIVDMTLGTRLRGLREKRGLTGRATATYLGISAAHVSDMESGKAFPSLDLLIRLARFFDTSTDYLLGVTDDPAAAEQRVVPPFGLDIWSVLRELPQEQGEELVRIGHGMVEAERRADERLRNFFVKKVEEIADGAAQASLADAIAAVRVGDRAGAMAIIDAFFAGRPPQEASQEPSEDV